jgi:hypothetical protein
VYDLCCPVRTAELGLPALLRLTYQAPNYLAPNSAAAAATALFPHPFIPPPHPHPQVALNIMWTHLEQRSFKMTEEQYMEKLDAVATMVNVLGQTDKVRSFLSAPAKSQNGMPRRPVVGTAISIQFEMDKATIEEWFGNGYQ